MRPPRIAGARSASAQKGDCELVARCLSGDQSAWEALVTRYQRLVYSIPIKARLPPEDAADIFQSVCLKLYEKLSTLREHERISSWLITTTNRETWRTAARSRRDTAESLPVDDEIDVSTVVPDTRPLADDLRIALDLRQAVRQAVDALPGRCREILSLLFYQSEELSYADVARLMQMPVSSVGPTRARCLKKLRVLLQDKI